MLTAAQGGSTRPAVMRSAASAASAESKKHNTLQQIKLEINSFLHERTQN
jgi:hypothetical protein